MLPKSRSKREKRSKNSAARAGVDDLTTWELFHFDHRSSFLIYLLIPARKRAEENQSNEYEACTTKPTEG
jgi:hypothetical protein